MPAPRLDDSVSEVYTDQVRIDEVKSGSAWWGPRVHCNTDAHLLTDPLPPTVTGVTALVTGPADQATCIYVTFSKPVSHESAENPAHYALEPATRIESAVLDPHFQQMLLHTAPLEAAAGSRSRSRAWPVSPGTP